VIPVAETMGAIGLAALAGNAFCFVLLRRHRTDDLNMRSTWLCSRNDLLANAAVLLSRSPDRLRELRALEVLEHIGSAEAKAVLQGLVTSVPGSLLAEEAEASLKRMK